MAGSHHESTTLGPPPSQDDSQGAAGGHNEPCTLKEQHLYAVGCKPDTRPVTMRMTNHCLFVSRFGLQAGSETEDHSTSSVVPRGPGLIKSRSCLVAWEGCSPISSSGGHLSADRL